MNERTHFFIKNIPLTLYTKGLMLVVCERWVKDGNRLIHIDPKFFWPKRHFFRILDGLLNRGSLRVASPLSAAGSQSGILSPTDSNCNWNLNWNWQTQAVCGTWLYNCLKSTCFLWTYASAPNSTTSTGQSDIPISSTGYTYFAVPLLIYTSASLD